MIYRIERCPVDQGSTGFYWAATLKDAKRLQGQSRKEYLAAYEDDIEISIETFETPSSKPALLNFLTRWCDYPDNG